MPSFESLDDFFAALPSYFNREAARDVEAVVQFEFSDDEDGGAYFVVVEDGRIEVGRGRRQNPTATVRTRSQDWLDVVNGRLNPTRAMVTRKLKMSGPLHLAARIPEIFGLT